MLLLMLVAGYDSTLVPLDFQRAGQIVDDDILRTLVKPMRKGVTVTVLVRFLCCVNLSTLGAHTFLARSLIFFHT